jgi:hypothetical protein
MRLRRRLLPAETAAAGGADTGLVGKLRRSGAVSTAGKAVVHSLTQPVTCTCSLLIRGTPSKKVSWPEK